MKKEIRQTWLFNQMPDVVWDYLTRPELLEEWFTKTDFLSIVGHKFNFYDKSGKVVSCQVLEAYPFTKLSYSWEAISANGGGPFSSRVTWTLVPKGDGTELQLVHTGFIELVDHDAHSKGWSTLGSRFVERLNTRVTQ